MTNKFNLVTELIASIYEVNYTIWNIVLPSTWLFVASIFCDLWPLLVLSTSDKFGLRRSIQVSRITGIIYSFPHIIRGLNVTSGLHIFNSWWFTAGFRGWQDDQGQRKNDEKPRGSSGVRAEVSRPDVWSGRSCHFPGEGRGLWQPIMLRPTLVWWWDATINLHSG